MFLNKVEGKQLKNIIEKRRAHMRDIKELKRLLELYEEAYYETDEELVSDQEYDAIKEEYLKAIGKDEYDIVPGGSLFNKFTHKQPILSLNKVNIVDEEKLRKELLTLMKDDGIVIEPKFDGLTIVKYSDGRCVTRGDGIIGEDVTNNCKNIASLMTIDSDYDVRAEIMMFKDSFEEINKQREEEGLQLFKNPRNAAAGMLRNKDASKVKGLVAVAYDLIGHEGTQLEMLDDMKPMDITPYWHFNDVDKAIDFIKAFDRNDYGFEMDGLVAKANCRNSLSKFGSTGHHPKNAIAIKFVAEKKWTQIKDITWQIGKSGKVVPVAEFDPIDIMGSTVSRATLHNKAYIEAMELDKDTFEKEVLVTKANDIIPAVIGSRYINNAAPSETTLLHIPTHCPDCESKLELVADQLFCRNKFCKEKVIFQAVHMASRTALDINGLSEETIRKMYEISAKDGNVNFTFPLAFSTEESFKGIEGFAEKSSKKMAEEIVKKTDVVPMSNFLIASGVNLMGKTASRLIAKNFKNLEEIESDLFENDCKKLKALDGIGTEIIKNMKAEWSKVILLSEYISGIKSEYKEAKKMDKEQLTFVITGTLAEKRSYYEDLIINAGHKTSGSVSKKTSYLLAGEDAGSKLEKANSLGIKVINAEELIELL